MVFVFGPNEPRANFFGKQFVPPQGQLNISCTSREGMGTKNRRQEDHPNGPN